jgi:hypothetical protein
LSPNPVSNQLFIRGYENVKQLSIYTMSGQEMMKLKNPGNTVSLQALQNGMYVIVLERTDGSTKKIKILKK